MTTINNIQVTEAAAQAYRKIKAWRNDLGMPTEYVDWAVAAELVAKRLVTQESPGPGWGLYLVTK